MPELPDADRKAIYEKHSARRGSRIFAGDAGQFDKAEARAILNAVDKAISDNALLINNLFPVVPDYRRTATPSQKARMLALLFARRAERGI